MEARHHLGKSPQRDCRCSGFRISCGHLNDVLRLNMPPYVPTLVASDTSGVWVANEQGGPALPLSTQWDATHSDCLAAGISSELRVYAAGDALSETDTTAPAPLFKWRKIPTQTDDPRWLDRFGRTLFGHSTLIARKLIDEGVRFVNATWDLDDSGASTRRWW